MKIGIHHIVELLALVVAIYCYPQLKGSYMKWFLPFLLFVLFGELYEAWLSSKVVSTIPVNYLIGVVESAFYGYIFYHLMQNRWMKNLVIALIILSLAGYAISCIIYGPEIVFFVYNLVVTGFILSTIGMIYLYQQFRTGEGHMLSDPGFWLTFGICLFFPGISIVFMTWKTIYVYKLSLLGMPLYQLVPKLLCVVLYGSISMTMITYSRKQLRSPAKIGN